LTSNPELRKEHDAPSPRYAVITAVIKARAEKNMSQAELAECSGTKQSNISRLENGNANPSIGFLQKIATALDKELIISFK